MMRDPAVHVVRPRPTQRRTFPIFGKCRVRKSGRLWRVENHPHGTRSFGSWRSAMLYATGKLIPVDDHAYC